VYKHFLSSGHWLVRFLWIDMIMFGYRFKYYFAWKFAEGALASSGIGKLEYEEREKHKNDIVYVCTRTFDGPRA